MAGLSLRRLRRDAHVRALTREVRVHADQLVQPVFVVDGLAAPEPVEGIDACFRETAASLPARIEADLEAGVRRFLLFGVPAGKRERGADFAFTAAQVAALRQRFGDDAWLATDLCLCSHTPHGHCGVLDATRSHVDNAATVTELVDGALALAEAGAHCIAPSDMMDGRVGAIRTALDAAGRDDVLIMSYAAKFHSRWYGPFRNAADSAPVDGPADRAGYQLDPAGYRDALRSARRDAAEGADLLMVKPGLPYLDVLARLAAEIPAPWAVYQVSGEQAALDLLARAGLADRDAAQWETWTAFARAGAQVIISYAARRAAAVLARG